MNTKNCTNCIYFQESQDWDEDSGNIEVTYGCNFTCKDFNIYPDTLVCDSYKEGENA